MSDKLSELIRKSVLNQYVDAEPVIRRWADEVAALEQRVEIKISDGDVWLVFPDTMISIEGICRFGAPGPIVKRNLRRWRDEALAKEEA